MFNCLQISQFLLSGAIYLELRNSRQTRAAVPAFLISRFALRGLLVFLLAGPLNGVAADASAPALASVTVEAGQYERVDTPVSVELSGVKLRPGAVRLTEVKDGQRRAVPSQVDGHAPARLCWILDGVTPAGARRLYELGEGAAEVTASGVQLRDDGKVLDVVCGGALALRYNHAPVPPPEGKKKAYARGAFIHPLWSPAGKVLTQIHAPDHTHHMGLWNAWTHTKFEGREVDFWNIGEGKGTVRFVKFSELTAGQVFGSFHALQEHVDLGAPGGGKVALREDLEVRVWNQNGKRWLLDYDSRQRCADTNALQLLKYRYGGVGFRGTADWNKDNSDYLTSEGKTRKDGHGTRARWCRIAGMTQQGPAGLVIMSHPANRGHPEPMRIWSPADNNGAIFFNFCSVQQKDWTLEPGSEYELRYRYYVFDGEVSAAEAERAWRDYAHPPEVILHPAETQGLKD